MADFEFLEQCQDRTLRFLCEAATQYAILAPAVSRSLGRRLRNFAKGSKVALHPTTEQLLCSKCSQVYVPGMNCRVSTWLKKKKRRRKKAKARTKPPKPLQTNPLVIQKKEHTTREKAEKPKRFVQYSCGVCRHRRRIPLPRRQRTAKPREEKKSSFQTVAQKKQAAASEEARNAARVAKRQKAKAKAAKAGGDLKAPQALQAPQAAQAGTAAVATQPAKPDMEVKDSSEVRRKRPREDQLSRVTKQLETQRAASSSGFEFWLFLTGFWSHV